MDDFLDHQSLGGHEFRSDGSISAAHDLGMGTSFDDDFASLFAGESNAAASALHKAHHDDFCLVGPTRCPINPSYANPPPFTLPVNRHSVPASIPDTFGLPPAGGPGIPFEVEFPPLADVPGRREQSVPFWAHNFFSRPASRHTCRPCSRGDDDSTSLAGSSCIDSQCCQGVNCDGAASACTDENCFPSSEVTSAAFALTTFNEVAERQQAPERQGGFHPQANSAIGQWDLSMVDMADGQFISPHLLTNEFRHLVEEHIDPLNPTCVNQSCPISDPKFFQECHFRPPTPEGDAQQQMNAFLASLSAPYADSNFQMAHSADGAECGTKLDSMEAYIKHFNDRHRHQLAVASMPTYSGLFTLPAPMGHPSVPSVRSGDSGQNSSIAADSPATPFSMNTDTSEVILPRRGQRHGQYSSRSSSVSAPASVITMQAGDEFRCFWCDPGPGGHVCGKDFYDAEQLHRHVISDHVRRLAKGPDGFSCGWEGCRRGESGKPGFPQRSKIERHMQTHTGSKPHLCNVCHKEFSAKQALEQHKLIHSNQRPLQCHWDGCRKFFRQQSALTMHLRVHSGEKPLVCEICNRRFSESSNLSKHKRTHEVRGRYVCSFEGCGKDFHRQDQLRRHMKQHDGPRTACNAFQAGFGGSAGVGDSITSEPVPSALSPSLPSPLSLGSYTARPSPDSGTTGGMNPPPRPFVVPPLPGAQPPLGSQIHVRKHSAGVKKRGH